MDNPKLYYQANPDPSITGGRSDPGAGEQEKAYTPTESDINRLEKAAWDANADRVLVWYRDQIDNLRERLREADRAMKLDRQRAIRAEKRLGSADPSVPVSQACGQRDCLWRIPGRVEGSLPTAPDASGAESTAGPTSVPVSVRDELFKISDAIRAGVTMGGLTPAGCDEYANALWDIASGVQAPQPDSTD